MDKSLKIIYGIWIFAVVSSIIILPLISSSPLSDNLISYYKLDETSGAVLDAHGDNDGTVVGCGYEAVGKINTALDFESGDPDYVTMGDNFDFLHTDSFSVSMWIKREDVSYDYPNLFSKGDRQSPYKGYYCAIFSTNRLYFVYIGDTGSMSVTTDDAVVPTTATWYHVVVTYANKVVKFYVDGDLKASTAGVDTLSASSGTSVEFNLGNRDNSSGTDTDYDGLIDEVGIWDKELTQAEITSLYNSGNGLAYPFAEDTCTCAGLNNNWEIDMADNCEITEACDLGTGTLSFTGAGWCKCNASVDTTNLGDPGASGTLYIQDSCKITID